MAFLNPLPLGRGVSIRGVAQLAARRAHNPEAAGSSPAPASSLAGQVSQITRPSPRRRGRVEARQPQQVLR